MSFICRQISKLPLACIFFLTLSPTLLNQILFFCIISNTRSACCSAASLGSRILNPFPQPREDESGERQIKAKQGVLPSACGAHLSISILAQDWEDCTQSQGEEVLHSFQSCSLSAKHALFLQGTNRVSSPNSIPPPTYSISKQIELNHTLRFLLTILLSSEYHHRL